MPQTELLKLFVAVAITFILILPEYFKTPQGRTLELSCLEVCLLSNFTYSLSLKFSSVTFLLPVKETQILMGVFPKYSHFPNVTKACQNITSKLTRCSLCLVCESKGNMDFISTEQLSEGLIMRGSMAVKDNDFYSPCQHFNVTIIPTVDYLEEYNTSCNLKTHTRTSTFMEKKSLNQEESLNHTCRTMEYDDNCIHIYLHLEMDVKYVTCSMKIAWYILVLLVFIFLIIFIIHKVLEGHRRAQKWHSDKCKPMSDLLGRGDSEKQRALTVRVISESTQGLPWAGIQEALPPIPELEATSLVFQQDLHTQPSVGNLD
ncbi:transmembrane protein 156 isoform X2 [Perognathus longimembris pacificus]|uniref:transmembrane protein 156 isoform X2 n=1 Tax=Perognathus longimembris pacificus TaxID=214514 RepID=UPI0020185832|nr:transmembrane protein 156 isoform X2 [Perognathus longimembris pacificus]